jgi:hypothetical protein
MQALELAHSLPVPQAQPAPPGQAGAASTVPSAAAASAVVVTVASVQATANSMDIATAQCLRCQETAWHFKVIGTT